MARARWRSVRREGGGLAIRPERPWDGWGASLITSTIMPQVRISNVRELAHGETRKYTFERTGELREGFLLRYGDTFVAYLNECRHWRVDLDAGEGRFFSAKLNRIYCRTHGACYVPLTGECDFGPCAGERLEQFDVHLEGEDAIVNIPELGHARK